MSRPVRIIRNIAIGLTALAVVVCAAAWIVLHTARFQAWARDQIVSAIAEGTGGKTEIGSFTLDVSHMHARLTNLVIRGSEPAGAAPFVRVAQVDLQARLFGGGGIVGISYLGIRKPEVNVMVFPDGHTNLPTPKPSAPSKTTPLETVVDLAVGHFELSQGSMVLNNQKQALDVTANNLRAQLWYRLAHADYTGRISLEPVYVVSGRNTPVTYSVTLPLALERDHIRLEGASIVTPNSALHIDGSLENLRQPAFSGHIQGQLALADLNRTLGLDLEAAGRGLPRNLQLDVNATGSSDRVQVTSAVLDLGSTHFQASGALKGASGSTLQFDGSLNLAELAGLARVATRPQGSLVLHGDATLDAANNYKIAGHVFSRNLALRQGTLRIPSAAIATDVRVDPASVELTGLRVDAFGGEFAGKATLQNFAQYQVTGDLRHLDLHAVEQLVQPGLPYSGTLSGPVEAHGDLHVAGVRSLEAQAKLAIAPGKTGIPLEGRLQAGYAGASGDVRVENSYLALPHSRLTVAGSTEHGLNVTLVTRDLHDLLAAVPSAGPPPVTLAGGQAGFTGTVTGALATPHIAGHLFATQFQVEGRAFKTFGADVAASPSGASLANGSLERDAMSASFSGAVGMHDWKPGPQDRLAADLNLQNGDVADLLAMAGQPPAGYSGTLTATAHVAGTMGNPEGSVALHAAGGSLHGEPFDRLDAQIGLTDRRATIQQATLTAGNARIDLSGSFQHPRDSFSEGTVQASLRTSQVDLARLHSLPNAAGQLQLSADIMGSLGTAAAGASSVTGAADRQAGVLAVKTGSGPTQTEFLLTSVQANATVRGLQYQGQAYGDVTTTVQTSGQSAVTDVTSDFAGSNIHVHGTTQLVSGYPTNADAQIAGLAVERALAIAGRGDIPVKGKLSATAHVHGTLDEPEGDASVDLTNAVVYGEPLDRLELRATNSAQSLEVTRLDAAAGPSHLGLTARFDHPAGRLDTGTVQFHVANGHLDLSRLKTLQNARPGLAGTVEISADGSAEASPGATPFRLTTVNANVAAANVALAGKPLGGLTLAAHTASAGRVDFTLTSDLAGAAIQAGGNAQLAGDYPVNAQLSFTKLQWTNLAGLLGAAPEGPPGFQITAEGKASVNGPLLKTADLQGSLDLTTLQLQTLPEAHTGRPVTIQNQGPIELRMDRGAVTLAGFHLTGPQTDIQASGNAALNTGSLNVTVNAGVDLAVLQDLSRDIDSSGKVTLVGAVRGTLANPQANGSLQLQNANFNYAALPNGLSNANGTIAFQGNRATIQNLAGESGGGKVTLSGFAMLGLRPRFAVHANATNVRVRVQEGVSITASAAVQVSGVVDNSTATGTVTLTQLNYAPQSDLGSILTRAAPDVESAPAPNPLLDHMKLDVRVRSAVSMRVQASLAENLQTDVDLRLSGSASRPTVLGRIDLDQGRLVFFGSTYTVNSGNITFADPSRIRPILNLSLETQTKGVDVVLNVAGPLDNMKLTYSSDPPLQFQEIATLLSTGKAPTSDPTLLANQPAQPSQTFEQSGESAILGQAVANPVASRLQRVFGVSQLSIDPTFTGSSTLPTAQVTLQQHVSTNLTFTYTSALDDPNSTLIRAEWALNPRWSATAMRDQNGIVSVNLLYKKQFR